MPAMTKEQLEHFEHFGFVTAEQVLDPEEVIDPVIDEYAGVLDNLADELYEDGTISSKYERSGVWRKSHSDLRRNRARCTTGTSIFRCRKAESRRIRRSGQGQQSSTH